MCRWFKSSKKNREKYIYYGVDDKRVVITSNEAEDFYIQLLHELDDNMVDENRRFFYKVSLVEDYDEEKLHCDYNVEEEFLKNEDEKELKNSLKKAIDCLNENQKQLFHKKYIKNLTNVEIAKEEGVGESAIRSRMKTIRKKIKKSLSKDCD